MEKIVISIEDMAMLLQKAFEENSNCVSDGYCRICEEMHDGCPNGDDFEKSCPHETIVEYRYFVRSHFKKFIKRNCDESDECLACSQMDGLFTKSDAAYLCAQAGMQLGLSIINALKYGVNDGEK